MRRWLRVRPALVLPSPATVRTTTGGLDIRDGLGGDSLVIERRQSGWVVGGYVIVLVGVVGFVVSAFLPYASLGRTISYYQLVGGSGRVVTIAW